MSVKTFQVLSWSSLFDLKSYPERLLTVFQSVNLVGILTHRIENRGRTQTEMVSPF